MGKLPCVCTKKKFESRQKLWSERVLKFHISINRVIEICITKKRLWKNAMFDLVACQKKCFFRYRGQKHFDAARMSKKKRS